MELNAVSHYFPPGFSQMDSHTHTQTRIDTIFTEKNVPIYIHLDRTRIRKIGFRYSPLFSYVVVVVTESESKINHQNALCVCFFFRFQENWSFTHRKCISIIRYKIFRYKIHFVLSFFWSGEVIFVAGHSFRCPSENAFCCAVYPRMNMPEKGESNRGYFKGIKSNCTRY